jgi:hypothetical protein
MYDRRIVSPRRPALVRIAGLALAGGCAPAPQPTAIPKSEPATVSAPTDSERCRDHGSVRRVEVAEGQTTALRDGLLVTYEGTMHDHYEDGTSDMILTLVFRGASETGAPLPSALTWMPSAVAHAGMHELPTGDCVRVADTASGSVVLEVAERAPSPALEPVVR